MLRRLLEIITGLVIGLAAFAIYGDEGHNQKLLVAYIFSNTFLQVLLFVTMVWIAFRLVGGKGRKDYGPFFFKLFVKIFGLPAKKDNG